MTPEQLKMLALDNSSDHSATATLIDRPPRSLREGLDSLMLFHASGVVIAAHTGSGKSLVSES